MMKQLAPAVFSIALVAGSGAALAAENSPLIDKMREAHSQQLLHAQAPSDHKVTTPRTTRASSASVTRSANVDID